MYFSNIVMLASDLQCAEFRDLDLQGQWAVQIQWQYGYVYPLTVYHAGSSAAPRGNTQNPLQVYQQHQRFESMAHHTHTQPPIYVLQLNADRCSAILFKCADVDTHGYYNTDPCRMVREGAFRPTMELVHEWVIGNIRGFADVDSLPVGVSIPESRDARMRDLQTHCMDFAHAQRDMFDKGIGPNLFFRRPGVLLRVQMINDVSDTLDIRMACIVPHAHGRYGCQHQQGADADPRCYLCVENPFYDAVVNPNTIAGASCRHDSNSEDDGAIVIRVSTDQV
jgi:hypothetical protein